MTPQKLKSTGEVFPIILDYCGGKRTDRLVDSLLSWNGRRKVYVLDNASPRNQCSHITHRNAVNTFVGGGIRDCLRLAIESEARFLLFLANDIECVTPLSISSFEDAARADTSIVQVSASITADTAQASQFPWMVTHASNKPRVVPHADILACLIDTNFVLSFRGFPYSKGGWGYSWELAYHARLQTRSIIVLDSQIIRHSGLPQEGDPRTVRTEKAIEADAVYKAKYGEIPWLRFRRASILSLAFQK